MLPQLQEVAWVALRGLLHPSYGQNAWTVPTVTVIETLAAYLCGYMPLRVLPNVHLSNDKIMLPLCVGVKVVLFNGTQWHRLLCRLYCPCSARKGDHFSRGCRSCGYLILCGPTLFIMNGKHLHIRNTVLALSKISYSLRQEFFFYAFICLSWFRRMDLSSLYAFSNHTPCVDMVLAVTGMNTWLGVVGIFHVESPAGLDILSPMPSVLISVAYRTVMPITWVELNGYTIRVRIQIVALSDDPV